MISTTENVLRRSDYVLVANVLYLAGDTRKFFLADAYGKARPAAEQPDVFQALLEAEIPAMPVPWLAGFLQSTLDALIASEAPPPAPRYPQVGDHCTGLVIWVQQTKQLVISGGGFSFRTIWVGYAQPSIAANGFSTPPANDETADFRFSFASTTPVAAGAAVHFTITQGKHAPFAVLD